MIVTDVTMQFGRTPGSLRLPAPRLGEHTDTVLASIGYSAEQIAAAAGIEFTAPHGD
jgi:crotonobetainyl-CoA:carnitine CoA-transferase CaiB-like acyl-CoA transferase